MEPHSQVLTTFVEFEGETYKASYFVEHGIIHANIDGRILRAPQTNQSAEGTVQSLLRGYLLQKQRKHSQRSGWLEQTPPLA